MSKENLRFPTLRDAMSAVQEYRQEEGKGHIWQQMFERYGEGILFAEIAAITGRLEQIIWVEGFSMDKDVDHTLDLLIDLGNYAEFLYMSLIAKEQRKETVIGVTQQGQFVTRMDVGDQFRVARLGEPE